MTGLGVLLLSVLLYWKGRPGLDLKSNSNIILFFRVFSLRFFLPFPPLGMMREGPYAEV